MAQGVDLRVLHYAADSEFCAILCEGKELQVQSREQQVRMCREGHYVPLEVRQHSAALNQI